MWPNDSALVRRWLENLQDHDVISAGRIALAIRGEQRRSSDGRAIGCLSGALANDIAAQQALAVRGIVLELQDHCAIATETIAHLGPSGLGALRWQGALAVAHLGQRQVLAARDPMGVGRLWASIDSVATCIASDPTVLESIVGSDAPRQSVPAGVVAQFSDRGVQWAPLQIAPENRAYYREIPPEIAEIPHDQLCAHLALLIEKSAQSLARGTGGLFRLPINVLQEQWLVDKLPWPAPTACGGLWTLRGTASLLGQITDDEIAAKPGPWPAIAAPEPTERGADASTRRRRIWRATWLTDTLLPMDHLLADQQDRHLVAPQLDAPVLALLGAWQLRHPPTSLD